MEKVTVIGGGNGGFATAADLTIRGHQVTLFELPQFSSGLSEVIKRGGIDMEAYANNGLQGGFAKLHKITTNISEAIAESDIIFVVVPAYSMNTIASMCAPHLRDGQIVVLTPANFGGSLYFHNVMKQQGCTAQVTLAEFSCMMYACRKKSPSSVWVRGYKHNMGVACFPAAHTDEVVAKLKVLYPYLIKYNNILETALSNINTTLHTSLMLLNAANIDNEEDRLFYRECCTKSLDNLLDALDVERRNINVLENTEVRHLNNIVLEWYEHQGAKGETVSEIQNPWNTLVTVLCLRPWTTVMLQKMCRTA
ncbi:MAG: NAD/NADP octopine/nopaline dehydrogenase family protein [Parasutterella excrementihominis]